MVNLLPQCIKCGSPVTDSLVDEIEEHGKIKTGSYIKGVWTCNDCIIAASQAQKKEGRIRNSISFFHTHFFISIFLVNQIL
jgi:hypothetical protein